MRYRALIGGMLVCPIIGLIAISFRSGPASTTAAPTTTVEHSPPPVSYKVDPAANFKQFSRDFVAQLNNLPAVKVEFRETFLYEFDETLKSMQEDIRNAEAAYGDMRAVERQKKSELASLNGKRVLATPGEHLKNMRASYEQQKKLREEWGKIDLPRWKMKKFHWSATYEMDARKTDSILTPYVGTITIQGTWYSGETKEGSPKNYRFTFAAQEEKWVLQSPLHVAYDGKTWHAVNPVWDPQEEGGQGLYFQPLMAPAAQSP